MFGKKPLNPANIARRNRILLRIQIPELLKLLDTVREIRRGVTDPEIAPHVWALHTLLFRPGSGTRVPLFMQGRVLYILEQSEQYSSFACGVSRRYHSRCRDDPLVAMCSVVSFPPFIVLRPRESGKLATWGNGLRWPHSDWHSEQMTTMRHARGQLNVLALR